MLDTATDRDWFSGALSAGSHAIGLNAGLMLTVHGGDGAVLATFSGSGSYVLQAGAGGAFYFGVSGTGPAGYWLTVGGVAAPIGDAGAAPEPEPIDEAGFAAPESVVWDTASSWLLAP